MLKRLRQLSRTFVTGHGTGHGTGGNTRSRSWGGCRDKAELNGHHCGGHAVDAADWQHRCPCGFRWAA